MRKALSYMALAFRYPGTTLANVGFPIHKNKCEIAATDALIHTFIHPSHVRLPSHNKTLQICECAGVYTRFLHQMALKPSSVSYRYAILSRLASGDSVSALCNYTDIIYQSSVPVTAVSLLSKLYLISDSLSVNMYYCTLVVLPALYSPGHVCQGKFTSECTSACTTAYPLCCQLFNILSSNPCSTMVMFTIT